MAHKNYDEATVVDSLNRKHDLKANHYKKTIQELKTNSSGTQSKGDVGIKTKGKIDFLVNYKGWNHFFVNKFE